VLVRGFIDEGSLDEQRIDIHPGRLSARIGHGALDQLPYDRRGSLWRKLQELERFARLATPNKIDDDPSFARTYPRVSSDSLADHDLSLFEPVVPTRIEPLCSSRGPLPAPYFRSEIAEERDPSRCLDDT
jgi:hypothetical protein